MQKLQRGSRFKLGSDKRVGRKVVRVRATVREGKAAACFTLQQAFDLFFHAKSGEGLRRRTLADYKTHHRYLTEWLSSSHPEIRYVKEITASVLREYINYLTYEKPQYAGHPYKSREDRVNNFNRV